MLTTVPPDDASYHLSVPPSHPLADKFTVPGPHRVSPVVDGAPGRGLTVTLAELEQVSCVPPALVPVTLIWLVIVADGLADSVQLFVAPAARLNVVFAGL